MATCGTVLAGSYQRELERMGIEWRLPSGAAQDALSELIYSSVKAGGAVDKDKFYSVAADLEAQGAEAHILGCTELSVINRSLPHEARFIDSTEALAYYTIRLCGKTPTGFAPSLTAGPRRLNVKLEKIISGYPCEVTGDISREIDELEYSSSECTANTLFFCLRGANADGHNYAADAYRRGCRAFVCDRALELGDGTVQIICEDTRAALASMSARFYGNCAAKLKIIGITGTKGKTTTSLLISAILNEAGHPCAYIGSNGIVIKDLHIDTVNTTPESRDLHHYFKLMADVGIEYVAMEVSSQALAHHRVDGISFAAGVFLNLSEDHIGGSEHPDFEDYRRSKARLFSEHAPRLAVYNADDCYSEGIVSGADCPKVTFSAAERRQTTLRRRLPRSAMTTTSASASE